ncbi:hypothetical protein BMR07_10605 [Methylococcaceae bacterium CS1]|nr:hypothetical protein BMR10_16160 [Methylococcaceae bacterium CS4]TXK94302.1 hypothetical protein BMR11_15460 [Methylococcaceae bacterium CS5]TXL02715.1 hypothetical protein BMR09_16340 [Methylococcaceae bacterium CS3]TXL05172.1 hypothetical protein BMR07_10605 [Methylococcaceae bacterium CS1]
MANRNLLQCGYAIFTNAILHSLLLPLKSSYVRTLLESGVQPSTKNVFSADHYRAIADMIFDSITKGHEIESSIILDDWLPEQHEKEKLYLLINSFKSAVTEKQWQKIGAWKMKS